uniref:Uncharacterized protein n=1 Tax=viral metagenome TaxID=1070528 RepID=A0A6C0F4F5_9ZZZZ
MSAQGLNATYLNSNTAYVYIPPSPTSPTGPPGVGIPTGPYATHFASDHTKRIKEAAMYREYNGAAVTTGSTTAYNNAFVVPVNYSIVQSNQNRLTYQFGAMTCSGCTGGFPDVPIGVEEPPR